jgi:hypothetical protein
VEIHNDFFQSIPLLQSICIPASVKVLRQSCFEKLARLVSVTFEQVSQVHLIERFAFSGCKSLTSIVLPLSIQIIDAKAFRLCSSLTQVIFEGDFWGMKIDRLAFAECPLLNANSFITMQIYWPSQELVSGHPASLSDPEDDYLAGFDQALIDLLTLFSGK